MMARFRPRLRFSIRTLFVVVTVFALGSGCVGYQWHVVHERQQVRAWMNERASQNQDAPNYGERLAIVVEGSEEVSWIRCLLGDTAEIRFDRFPTTKEEQDRYMSAYPNALVVEWTKEVEKKLNSLQETFLKDSA